MEPLQPSSPENGSSDSSSEIPPNEELSTPIAEVTESVSYIAANDISAAEENGIIKPRIESPIPEIINPRAYQREMLEQSLQRNVIVAMDTGSGKTQVAVLRIQVELERCSPDKIIWFLAKTVSLCEQQFNVVQRQMPSVSMKLLTGHLNIDAWSPKVWPEVLAGTRVIVSTFDILRDALDHAFVKMEMLALVVFDEVHNCVKRDAGRMIMVNFYHQEKTAGRDVPAILGLTASPVISSDLASIETLENTMDAICTTPTVHREELLRCVNKPHLVRSVYDFNKRPSRTPLMQALHLVYQKMDLTTDPLVLKLRTSRSEKGRSKLRDIIMKNDTFSQNQMKGLWNKSKDILSELGSWAADRYMSILIGEFLGRVDSADTFLDSWSNEDRSYLAGYLREVPIGSLGTTPPTSAELSHKASRLVHELVTAGNDVVGIVFVKERAAANVLCELLNSIPSVRKRYSVGTMVGTSSFGNRKHNMYEFNNGAGNQVLEDFRSGVINLLVATSVLEEGIDVPACNLVVCFDETTTLKSFIQRRGRARMQESKMIAMESSITSPRTWVELEEGMKKRYQDDQRELERLDELAKSELTSSISYVIKSSGARLDFDNARQHLDHFCRVVFKADFVDRGLDYIFHKEVSGFGEQSFRATVMLPSGLSANLRKFQSANAWKSEKNAVKDVAFHAYIALYEAGLVSEHLLPLNLVPDDAEDAMDLKVEPLFNPWNQVAKDWQQTGERWLYAFEVVDDELKSPARFEIALPAELPQLRAIRIYPDLGHMWSIKCVSGRIISHDETSSLPDHTSTLLASHFGHRWPVEDRSHVVKIIYQDKDLSRKQFGAVSFHNGRVNAISGEFFIRDPGGCPHAYLDMIASRPRKEDVQHPFSDYEEGPENELYLVLDKWTRRADWLHALKPDQKQKASTKPYGRVLPASWATMDIMPIRAAKLGMLIPSIIHDIEVQLIASHLSSTLLRSVGITDLQLVVEAISSRSAAEPVDYERLEFLGDSILKFCTVVQAYADHPTWPEGLLVHFKDRLVSNSRLRRACLESGLSKFILSKSFTGQKWRPLYLDKYLQEGGVTSPDRFIGPKTLADVVEALIGASFQDGGMPKALECISIFLGDKCHWHEEGRARDILFSTAVDDVKLPSTLEPLEELIGYSFRKKTLLIEATTHGSYAGDVHQRSYEQLEFLGDSVLDYIIVKKMFRSQPPISNGHLHMIKTGMVNADFLAFMNMNYGLRRKTTEVKPGGIVEETEISLPLWKFMRYTSPDMGREQDKATARFENMRGEILEALEKGTHYPWALLARLQSKKFYSDLVEALIGAVWVDSGSIEVCESVLHRFGIMPYLDRVLRENVHIQHPKEELSRLAVDKKVEYMHTVIEGPEPEYLCKVKIGTRVIVGVQGGVGKEEVMTKAAEQVVRILTEEKRAAELGVDAMDTA
ncbi:hypothetical protein FZEAL_7138 [Fusarium zealandicum]|uniref:Dicer-like protein 2 n=1 Tax=Fusarium zealandicum TaxID=1053134 RepID=A0A8H4UH46_9HYPO|nr:hypothetical protein FZEAL_7138 [Fusarium zealandicum]